MPERSIASPQLLLGFDFGLRRIGIARGDSLTRSAHPVKNVDNGPRGPDWLSLAKAFSQWQPAVAVIGLPYNADGSENAMTAAARAFAREVETRFQVRIDWADERYSSLDAQERLAQMRAAGARRKRVSKQDIDITAACIILERWFQQHQDGVSG